MRDQQLPHSNSHRNLRDEPLHRNIGDQQLHHNNLHTLKYQRLTITLMYKTHKNPIDEPLHHSHPHRNTRDEQLTPFNLQNRNLCNKPLPYSNTVTSNSDKSLNYSVQHMDPKDKPLLHQSNSHWNPRDESLHTVNHTGYSDLQE